MTTESVGKLHRGPGLSGALRTVSTVTFPSRSCGEAPNQKVTSLVRAAAVWKHGKDSWYVGRLQRSLGEQEFLAKVGRSHRGLPASWASTVKSGNNLAEKDSSPDVVNDAVQFLAGLAVVDSLGLGVLLAVLPRCPSPISFSRWQKRVPIVPLFE